MAKGLVVTADNFSKGMLELLSPLEQMELEEALTKVAKKVCTKYKPKIKKSADSKIKHVVSPTPYTSCFTVVKKDDTEGVGSSLWNRKYQLSHLIEDPHELWFGGRTTNNYEFWKDTEPDMADEFFMASMDVIDDAFKGK